MPSRELDKRRCIICRRSHDRPRTRLCCGCAAMMVRLKASRGGQYRAFADEAFLRHPDRLARVARYTEMVERREALGSRVERDDPCE